MNWRDSSTTKDKIFASLVYLVPLLEVLLFGSFLFALIPPLRVLFVPLFLLAPIYYYSIGGMAIIPLVVFFALYMGVIQNYQLSRFLRFNTMQALMLSVFAWLCGALLKLFGYSQQLLLSGFSNGTDTVSVITSTVTLLIGAIVFSAIFVVVVAASVYSVVQTLRGKYAEIPLISEAVNAQVRY